MDADDSPEREEQAGTKRCKKCGEEKALSEFHKDRQKKDGTRNHCKVCVKAWNAKYREENPEYMAKYRAENKDSIRATRAKYRAENKDRLKAYSAKYYAENIDSIKSDKARYYAENREACLAYSANYKKANPEKNRASEQRRRARKANAKGTFTADDWKARLAYHGYKCIYCGIEKADTKEKYLTMEHLIPLSRGGTNYPSNLAPSCKSCNCKKHTKTHFEFIEYLNDQKEV